ncbi:FliM/FliN family flagellar motor switch protein [Myxococcota bacterium]|nr:FliM/FliN family flagellar motor switch protein [Myxococcota bacterium]MBU1379932.1 FliM/FliN family flagellar motor switch protein [Myxococcota bacterium]MBU1498570.1 FliM/FliN family flagellar motor switch protein [Myxococcota bacterium]
MRSLPENFPEVQTLLGEIKDIQIFSTEIPAICGAGIVTDTGSTVHVSFYTLKNLSRVLFDVDTSHKDLTSAELGLSFVILKAFVQDYPEIGQCAVSDPEPETLNPDFIVRLSFSTIIVDFNIKTGNDDRALPQAALRYDFSLKIVACFLPASVLQQCFETGALIRTGKKASQNYYLGDGFLYIPVALNDGNLLSTGELFMNPRVSDNLSMDITVEIGKIRLSGKDLDAFYNGSVIPLGITPGGQVSLTTDGRLIARGELVTVDSELGIILTEVYGPLRP